MRRRKIWSTLPPRDRFRLAQALVLSLLEVTMAEGIMMERGPGQELARRLDAARRWIVEAKAVLQEDAREQQPRGASGTTAVPLSMESKV